VRIDVEERLRAAAHREDAVAFALVITLAGSAVPAWRIARLRAVEALHG
jgi:hypothetical protein